MVDTHTTNSIRFNSHVDWRLWGEVLFGAAYWFSGLSLWEETRAPQEEANARRGIGNDRGSLCGGTQGHCNPIHGDGAGGYSLIANEHLPDLCHPHLHCR